MLDSMVETTKTKMQAHERINTDCYFLYLLHCLDCMIAISCTCCTVYIVWTSCFNVSATWKGWKW